MLRYMFRPFLGHHQASYKKCQSKFIKLSYEGKSISKLQMDKVRQGKVIPVQAMQALRVARGRGSHILNIRLTDGGKVVSLTHRPLFTPRKIPGTHFC
jgi:hypothetical protein